MSKQIRQLMEYFTVLTNKHIDDEFESSNASKIKQIFKNEFQLLFSTNSKHITDELSAKHGVNPIFVIALKKALSDYVASIDELKRHVLAIYELIIAPVLESQKQQIAKSEDIWGSFIQNITNGNNQLYNNEYFKLEIMEVSDTKYGFDLNCCYYYEIFKLNGFEELGPILCDYDYLISDNLKHWIKFERTETIATGFTRCNFRFQSLVSKSEA